MPEIENIENDKEPVVNVQHDGTHAFVPLRSIYAACEIIAPYTCNLNNTPEKLRAAMLWHVLNAPPVKERRRAALPAESIVRDALLHLIVRDALIHLQSHDHLPVSLPVSLERLHLTAVGAAPVNNVAALLAAISDLPELAGYW